MGKRLDFFYIGKSYGGNQDWFNDFMMHVGGCGAVTACDTCIYLACRYGQTWMYPYDAAHVDRRDYLRFSRLMKPYLRPRAGGIDKPETYMDGFSAYLRDRWRETAGEASDCGDGNGASTRRWLTMTALKGTQPLAAAWQAVVRQIDRGFPVPTLILYHANPALRDYVWHWFLLTGYDEKGGPPGTLGATAENEGEPAGDVFCGAVEAVTYGESEWLDFRALWETGHETRGGLVLYDWGEAS